MAIIKNKKDNKCWDVEKLEPLNTVHFEHTKWYSQYGKQYGVPSKDEK
jgi:hypothetical protein